MMLYALSLEMTMVLAVLLALAAWQKDYATPGRRTFVLLSLSALVWCLGELLSQREIVDEVVADRIKYVGILSLPALWLGLATHAAHLEVARRMPWLPLVLITPQLCVYALLYSDPWSGLFLTTVRGGEDVRGPLWWITAAYSYGLITVGSAIIIVSAFRRRSGPWLSQLAAGVASYLPLAANAAYVSSGLGWRLDPTPPLLCVSLLALRSATFSGGLLQLLPVAQHDLMLQLPLGVVLTDRRGTVISVNPAAERRLRTRAVRALGRSLDAILAEADERVPYEAVPIASWGREVGELVLLDPPPKPGDGNP